MRGSAGDVMTPVGDGSDDPALDLIPFATYWDRCYQHVQDWQVRKRSGGGSGPPRDDDEGEGEGEGEGRLPSWEAVIAAHPDSSAGWLGYMDAYRRRWRGTLDRSDQSVVRNVRRILERAWASLVKAQAPAGRRRAIRHAWLTVEQEMGSAVDLAERERQFVAESAKEREVKAGKKGSAAGSSSHRGKAPPPPPTTTRTRTRRRYPVPLQPRRVSMRLVNDPGRKDRRPRGPPGRSLPTRSRFPRPYMYLHVHLRLRLRPPSVANPNHWSRPSTRRATRRPSSLSTSPPRPRRGTLSPCSGICRGTFRRG